MKRFLSLIFTFLFSISAGSIYAQKSEKQLTAFEVLKHAQRQLGRFGKDLLSMETENSKLQPRYWWIRFFDESLVFKIRAVQMIGPEMMKNLEPGNPFDGGNRDFIISPDLLKCDSDKCINFIEKAAKASDIPLHSLNIKLDKPHPGESNPIWHFELRDLNNKSLGTISISATTSKVTEIVGLNLKDKRFSGVSKKTATQSIEETFLGVGADLEETFTGKRTVDRDGEKSSKSSDKD